MGKPTKGDEAPRSDIVLIRAYIDLLTDDDPVEANPVIKDKLPWLDDPDSIKMFQTKIEADGVRINGTSISRLLLRDRYVP
jgi:hypothetical protein